MEGQGVQILLGALFLSATIIALVKIISAFIRRREKWLQSKDDGHHFGHGRYEKVATEDEEDDMEIADDGHSHHEVVRKSKDIFEEHMTTAQECFVVISCGNERAAAVCLFRNDAAVEYFVEDISECYERKSTKPLQSDLAHRVVMAALAAWSEKWYFAEVVNILCQEGSVVRGFNREGSHARRQLQKIEKKFSYKLFFQWTENYICDEVAEEDLWERTISLTKELLTPGGSSEDAIWRRFPLGYWPRRRIHLSMEHFQQ